MDYDAKGRTMDVDVSYVQQLVTRPAEGLNVELKTWLDPRTPEGKAKIIKAALALRNRNGGLHNI
jgi:hypothetical protein